MAKNKKAVIESTLLQAVIVAVLIAVCVAIVYLFIKGGVSIFKAFKGSFR